MMKKRVYVIFIIVVMLLNLNVMAEDEVENYTLAKSTIEAAVGIDKEINMLVDKLESVLDPENTELENIAAEAMNKHSDNWIVKLFNSVIGAIQRFLEKVLELASDAAKIGVE